MSEQPAYEREYENVRYIGNVWADDIGGFSYETGRNTERATISEKAIVPGDLVWITKNGREWAYRVVEVAEDKLLVFDKEDDSMDLVLIDWGEITAKIDAYSDFIDCNDAVPDEIEQKRPVDDGDNPDS